MENEEIDRILDKISSDGIDSLSVYEKKYLDSYSQHDGHESEFVDPETARDMDDEKRGEEITSDIPQLEGMTFRYEDRLDLDDNSVSTSGRSINNLIFGEKFEFPITSVDDVLLVEAAADGGLCRGVSLIPLSTITDQNEKMQNRRYTI